MRGSNGYGKLIGAGALGGAVIALGVAAFTAMGDTATVDSPALAGAESPAPGLTERLPASVALTGGTERVQLEDVQLATSLAPFEEDRSWSGERYQLPGERVTAPTQAPQPQREPEPAPEFEVLGTAASTGSSLAVIRVGNGTPQMVAVGERMEGYEVASIDDGRVVMRNGDRSVNLSVASASPTGASNERNARQGQNRNQGNNRGNANEAQTRAALERLMGAAMDPAVRERIEVQMERAFEAMGDGSRIQVNGNQIVVTGANGQQRMVVGIPQGGPAGAAPSVVSGRITTDR